MASGSAHPQTDRPIAIPTTTDDLILWQALHRLAAAYWRDVDIDGGRNAHTFYTSDGALVVGHNRFEGPAEIRAFYDWRRRQAAGSVSGATTTRHLVSNLLVNAGAEGDASMVGIVSLYGGVARGHTAQSKPPILMADLRGDCRREADGQWRFVAHVLQPVFVSHETALSMALDTRSHRAWAAPRPTSEP
jgi:hypothetical protein